MISPHIYSDFTDENKIRILHIDDNESYLDVIKLFLEEESQKRFQIDIMTSSQEILLQLKEKTYDIIISDYEMPGINGLQLLENLRNQGIQIPFIMLTGRGREEVAIEALNLGADRYIKKGDDIKSQIVELFYAIQTLFKQQQTEKILKEREVQFRWSEEKYQAMFNECPVSIWEEDFTGVREYLNTLQDRGITNLREYLDKYPDEVENFARKVKIIDINNTTLKMYGAENKEELLANIDKIFDKNALVMFKEELIGIAKGVTSFHFDTTQYKLTGENFPVYMQLFIPSDFKNSLERVLFTVTDISYIKKIENQLKLQIKESTFSIRSALEIIKTPITVTSANGSILFINSTMEKLMNRNAEQIVEQRIQDFYFDPQEQTKLMELFDKEGNITNYELRLVKPDKSIIWLKVSMDQIKFENESKAIISVFSDITILKYKTEELSIFAHTMAHDLRNYLSAIDGYNAILKMQYNSDYSIKIEALTQNIFTLLKKSLELADAGLIINKNYDLKVNLNKLVKEIGEITTPKKVHLNIGKLPVVRGDPEKLSQLFKNLFENAIVHAKATSINVYSHIGKLNYIKIVNSGIPITPEMRKLINSKKTTGFGLKIIQKIVEAHNWKIMLEDPPQNREAKFTFFRIDIPSDAIII